MGDRIYPFWSAYNDCCGLEEQVNFMYIALVNLSESIDPEAWSKTILDNISESVVMLEGEQTISGDKKFSGSVYAVTPTEDTQVANKSYVDETVDSHIAEAGENYLSNTASGATIIKNSAGETVVTFNEGATFFATSVNQTSRNYKNEFLGETSFASPVHIADRLNINTAGLSGISNPFITFNTAGAYFGDGVYYTQLRGSAIGISADGQVQINGHNIKLSGSTFEVTAAAYFNSTIRVNGTASFGDINVSDKATVNGVYTDYINPRSSGAIGLFGDVNLYSSAVMVGTGNGGANIKLSTSNDKPVTVTQSSDATKQYMIFNPDASMAITSDLELTHRVYQSDDTVENEIKGATTFTNTLKAEKTPETDTEVANKAYVDDALATYPTLTYVQDNYYGLNRIQTVTADKSYSGDSYFKGDVYYGRNRTTATYPYVKQTGNELTIFTDASTSYTVTLPTSVTATDDNTLLTLGAGYRNFLSPNKNGNYYQQHIEWDDGEGTIYGVWFGYFDKSSNGVLGIDAPMDVYYGARYFDKICSYNESSDNVRIPTEDAELTTKKYVDTKAVAETIAEGSLSYIAYSEISDYKSVTIYGYKEGIDEPNATCVTIIPDILTTETLLQYVCQAGSGNWEYRLRFNIGTDGNVYWFSDLDYSGNTNFIVTKITGVK